MKVDKKRLAKLEEVAAAAGDIFLTPLFPDTNAFTALKDALARLTPTTQESGQ